MDKRLLDNTGAFQEIFAIYEKESFFNMTWSFIDDHDERYIMGYDMAWLNMDSFYMNVSYSSREFQSIYLYSLRKDCIECPYVPSHHSSGVENTYFTGKYETNLKFRISPEAKEYFPQDDTSNIICDLNYNFQQFGIYSVDVNNSTGCSVKILKEPVNIYSHTYQIYQQKKIAETEKTAKKERIHSLDTFRGITIVLMIFANFGCGGYGFIEHVIWNGLHVADLVFPSFMWIMGVCIPISLSSSFKRDVPNKTIMQHVVKRSIKLFLIGIFLGSGSDLKYLRIFGVLQRFGVAYLVVTTVCVYCINRSKIQNKDDAPGLFDDILTLTKGWAINFAVLILHTIIIFCVSAPDCPKGYMGPGGLHKNLSYVKCIGGATGYIDSWILGNHSYQHPTIYDVYESKPFDPEGIVGCLPTVFHVFIGVQTGVTLLIYKKHSQRLIRWLLWSVITGLIGGALCGFSKEDGIIPVNKNLWSISFVMVTSSVAFALLSLCYVLVDVRKYWSGKPFLFAGMNAILMYIGHEMTDGHFPVRWYMKNDFGDSRRNHFLALLSDTWAAGIWVLVSYYLYKINYFFTV
ncbi:hypothetical protein NQ318_007334 [Aromia moschata]|uniref:Heparan-alpha-glucosaminide N-acetyltransferase catalytic domain-containing protein n=1 Tax=Aromia moschata TaxID=1265417 RepID=A0AAV8Z1N3_9CUCU|nr:hypothetical protein NQ318_007334 [Aromia moschata]